MGKGQAPALYFPARPELLTALNSGVRGQSPRKILQWRLVTQAAVGPLFVVVAPPSLDLFLSILQAQKSVLIQAFLPETAVERFDEGVIRGLPRPGKVQDHAMGVGPQVDFLGDKLRAVVQPDALRHPILGHCQVEV
jgi:hypothetical protein